MEPIVHISMLVSTEDSTEASRVLQDLLEHLKNRLDYWGYGLETSAASLMGEVL